MNDNNSNNNNNSSGKSSQNSPFLSVRGQYNPNLTQQQAHPNTYEQQAQPNLYQQSQPNSYQQQSQPNQYQQANQPHATKLKHSGLGISSFVLSIIAIITFILCFVLMFVGFIDLINSGQLDINTLSDPAKLEAMLLSGSELSGSFILLAIGGLFVLLSIAFAVIGLILGIIGATQKNRKKVFSILGIVFNGLVLIGFLISTLMGQVM